ncbi:hypothetical protein V6N13_070396 [Hibiscus sabdariffa]
MCRSFLLFFSISLSVAFAFAEIRFTKIKSDGRPAIAIDVFLFIDTGRLELNVSHVTLCNKNPNLDLAKLGFFICREAAWDHVLQQLTEGEVTCALDFDLVKLVFNFRSLNGKSSFDADFQVDNANQYTLALANCLDGGKVSMNVRSAMYNLEGKQNRRDYLSPAETNLPRVYFIWSLVYFTLAWIWIYVIHKGRRTVSRIHFLMLISLILNALNLVCQAEYKSHVKRTGSAHGWDVPFYIFNFFKGITLPVLVVLIGTSWSQSKPYLQGKVNKILRIVIPLQVTANIARIIFVEIPPLDESKYMWYVGFMFVDIICYSAVFLRISESIKDLHEAAPTDGNAEVNLEKLTLFALCYLRLICYASTAPLLVLSLVISSYESEDPWIGVLVEELAMVAVMTLNLHAKSAAGSGKEKYTCEGFDGYKSYN